MDNWDSLKKTCDALGYEVIRKGETKFYIKSGNRVSPYADIEDYALTSLVSKMDILETGKPKHKLLSDLYTRSRDEMYAAVLDGTAYPSIVVGVLRKLMRDPEVNRRAQMFLSKREYDIAKEFVDENL